MIVRQYVSGIQIDGMAVSTNGLQLTIQPGTMEVPGGKITLTEPVILDFPPAEAVSDIQIGFDGLGRLYVDRYDRGQQRKQGQTMRFGTLAHYIYFTLQPDTIDLADIAINVLCEAIKAE